MAGMPVAVAQGPGGKTVWTRSGIWNNKPGNGKQLLEAWRYGTSRNKASSL